MSDHVPEDEPGPDSSEPVGRDALAWLRERGVERQAIRLEPRPEDAGPPPRAREVANLADPPATHPAAPPVTAAPTDAGPAGLPVPSGVAVGVPPPPGGDAAAAREGATARAPATGAQPGPLADEVAKALDFVRRSTANSVQSRGRLADKLAERDVPAVVAAEALDRAEAEGLVDDLLVLPALVEERRAQGHAPRRIRDDLRQRGFQRQDVDAALEEVLGEDPHAAAFGLARERAAAMTTLEPETAVRRIVAWLARRGYPEALARKAARDAVFAQRETAEVAGR